MQFDWTISLGNILTVVTTIAYWIFVTGRKIARRHKQNLERLDKIDSGLVKLDHLDTCVDSLKNTVHELQAKIEALFKKKGQK